LLRNIGSHLPYYKALPAKKTVTLPDLVFRGFPQSFDINNMIVSSNSNNKMDTDLWKLIYIYDLLHVSAKNVTIFRKIQCKG
jgi:hypothetical protein